MNQVFELGGSFQIDRKHQSSISCLQQSFQSNQTMDSQQLMYKCPCEAKIVHTTNQCREFLKRPKKIIQEHQQEKIIFAEYLQIKYKEKMKEQEDQFINLRNLYRDLIKQVKNCKKQDKHQCLMENLSQTFNQCKEFHQLKANEVFAFELSKRTQVCPQQCSSEEIILVKNIIVSKIKNSQAYRVFKKNLVRSSQKELEDKKMSIIEINQDFRIKSQILIEIMKDEEERQDLEKSWKELEAHNEQTIKLIEEILKNMKASQFTFGQQQI